MIWLITSVPFWIIGSTTMAGGLVGIYGDMSRNEADGDSWVAFLLLMLVAAGAFYIAARIAS